MIEVKNLTKRYGAKAAVDNISFTVNEGEILGFLGPNGAGKTTTMNIITGYSSSTEGTVTVNGAEILENPIKVKSQIGYLPEHPPLYLDMTVKEYLSFMYDLKKVRVAGVSKQNHIAEICELVKITDVYPRIIKNLSKGYRQRVGLAQALLGNPSVLILDEPTVGLDPKQIIEIRNLIKSLGKKHTIILSSHILPEVQATCERVIVINKGKLIADDTPDNLSRAMSTDHKLTLRVDGPEDEVHKLLAKIPDMIRVDKLGLREGKVYDFTLEAQPGTDVRREVFKRLAERGWAILGLKSSELSLEDVFLQLTDDNNKQTYGIEKEESISLDDVVFEGEETIAAEEETTKEDSAQ
jgi:ABC-2 type transport system ATP-binding protein